MSRFLKIRLCIYAVVLAFAWYSLRELGKDRGDDAVHAAQTAAVLKMGKQHRAERAKHQQEVGRLRRKAVEQLKVADSLRRVRNKVPLPTLTPAVCAPFAQGLSLCEQETDSLRGVVATQDSIITADSTRLVKEIWRVDTLENLLRSAPKPCRVLGVRCPVLGPGIVVGKEGISPGVAVIIPLF